MIKIWIGAGTSVPYFFQGGVKRGDNGGTGKQLLFPYTFVHGDSGDVQGVIIRNPEGINSVSLGLIGGSVKDFCSGFPVRDQQAAAIGRNKERLRFAGLVCITYFGMNIYRIGSIPEKESLDRKSTRLNSSH